jgi:hypothetical protein
MLSWLGSNSQGIEHIVSVVTIIVGAITIFLTPINILTWWAIRRQTNAAEDQAVSSRKQIHADRVAEIFMTLRKFENFIVHSGMAGPGRDYSEFGNISSKGGKICEEYLELQEAFYLSRLISEPLFEFMKERMEEADGLQRIPDPDLFQKKLQEFHRSWDVYELANKLRELSWAPEPHEKKEAAMNVREGTRRLALLLGVVGAILGGFASYVELQTILNQRALQAQFEQLAASDVVQQERKVLQAWTPVDQTSKQRQNSDLPPVWSRQPQIDPKTGERVQPQNAQPTHGPWEKYAGKDQWEEAANEFRQEQSEVSKGGIEIIHWAKDYGVKSIETEDGQTLYPTPAPAASTYFLAAFFPVLGFFVPWGAVRAIGWVWAGFSQAST